MSRLHNNSLKKFFKCKNKFSPECKLNKNKQFKTDPKIKVPLINSEFIEDVEKFCPECPNFK